MELEFNQWASLAVNILVLIMVFISLYFSSRIREQARKLRLISQEQRECGLNLSCFRNPEQGKPSVGDPVLMMTHLGMLVPGYYDGEYFVKARYQGAADKVVSEVVGWCYEANLLNRMAFNDFLLKRRAIEVTS